MGKKPYTDGSRGRDDTPPLPPSHFPFAPRHSARGFTLIELVVAMTILTILTLGVIPIMRNSIQRQRETRLRETLREMREAVKEFHRDTVGIQCSGSATSAPAAPPPQAGQPGVPGQQPAGAYIDPRSKVVISDCTIFGVDNPDHYPPTLETLVEGVNVIARTNLSAASLGSVDTSKGQATDNALVSTKKKVYLSRVPTDPITGKPEWDLRSSYDESGSSSWGGQNVFDVRSKAPGEALNGEKYSDW